MTEPRHIVVAGYYGFGNTGDEAILEAFLRSHRARRPELEVVVASGDPDATRREHGVRAVSWQDPPGLADAVGSSRLVVLGGGGLFQDHWEFAPEDVLSVRHGNIGYWSGFALLAALAEVPLVLYAVGVGPLRTELGRRYTKLVFEQALRASVRDEASKRLVVELGVEAERVAVAADPCFAFERPSGGPRTARSGELRVGVAPRWWELGVDPECWLEQLAAALDGLLDRHPARVVLVPFQQSQLRLEDDGRVCSLLKRRLRHTERASVSRARGAVEVAAELGECDLVLGMRLHSVILAAGAGVPPVGISYDPKVALALSDLGLERFNVALEKLEAGALVERLEAALSEREKIAQGMTEALAGLRRRAERSYELVDEALEGVSDARRSPSAELVAALGPVVLPRLANEPRLEERIRGLENELANARAEGDALRSQVEALSTAREELLATRAVRLVTRMWEAKAAARVGVRKALWPLRLTYLRRAPRGLRTRLAGVERRMPWRAGSHGRDPADELEALLERHPERRGVVVFPPTIGWDVALFQRPQQMALALARLGYVVLYNLHAGNAEGVLGLREARENLYLCHLPAEELGALQLLDDPILFSYTYNFHWAALLRSPGVVYELIDDLKVFEPSFPLAKLEAWHARAIERAEVVVGTADSLVDDLKASRPDALLCPNAVDYRHFHDFDPAGDVEGFAEIEAIAAYGKPIVGFYGALAEWLDYDLMRHAARELRDLSFVLIGPDYDRVSLQGSGLLAEPNVRWLGVKPYQRLPGYLRHFDVATVPFRVNDVTHAVSPLKLFEYMAGGKPVVTTDLRECRKYPVVLAAKDSDDYCRKLLEALELGKDPGYLGELDALARANTWESRVEAILAALPSRS